jgi:hypothetical protein
MILYTDKISMAGLGNDTLGTLDSQNKRDVSLNGSLVSRTWTCLKVVVEGCEVHAYAYKFIIANSIIQKRESDSHVRVIPQERLVTIDSDKQEVSFDKPSLNFEPLLVCMYVCMHMHACMYMHLCIHTFMHTCMYCLSSSMSYL